MKKFMPGIFVVFMLVMGIAPLRAEYRALEEVGTVLERGEGETGEEFTQRVAAERGPAEKQPPMLQRRASQPALQVTERRPLLPRSQSMSDLRATYDRPPVDTTSSMTGPITYGEPKPKTPPPAYGTGMGIEGAKPELTAAQQADEAHQAALMVKDQALEAHNAAQERLATARAEFSGAKPSELSKEEIARRSEAYMNASNEVQATYKSLQLAEQEAENALAQKELVAAQEAAARGDNGPIKNLVQELNEGQQQIPEARGEANNPDATPAARASAKTRLQKLLTRRNALIAAGIVTVAVALGLGLGLGLRKKSSGGQAQAVAQQAAIPATPVDTGVTTATPVTMEIPEESGPQGGAVITPETPETSEMPETTPVVRTGMHKGMKHQLEKRERFTKRGIKPRAEHMKETGIRTRESVSEEVDRRLGVTPSKPASTQHMTAQHMETTGVVRKGYGTKYSAEHMKETGKKTRHGMSTSAAHTQETNVNTEGMSAMGEE